MILCFRIPTTQVLSWDWPLKRSADSSAETSVSETASSAQESLRNCRRAIFSSVGLSSATACRRAPESIRGSRPGASQSANQRRGVPTSAAHRLKVGIKLVDQGCHRQRATVAARLVQAKPQVLAHPVDREAEIEPVLHHRAAAVFHLPALRGTL